MSWFRRLLVPSPRKPTPEMMRKLEGSYDVNAVVIEKWYRTGFNDALQGKDLDAQIEALHCMLEDMKREGLKNASERTF